MVLSYFGENFFFLWPKNFSKGWIQRKSSISVEKKRILENFFGIYVYFFSSIFLPKGWTNGREKIFLSKILLKIVKNNEKTVFSNFGKKFLRPKIFSIPGTKEKTHFWLKKNFFLSCLERPKNDFGQL